tara:strand:+ start:711 stop:3743 length:3033 start_codon:yes stop_codon:yes gene_type:complete
MDTKEKFTFFKIEEFGNIKVKLPYSVEELNSFSEQDQLNISKEARSVAAKTVLGQYSSRPEAPVSTGRSGIAVVPSGLSSSQMEQVRSSMRAKPGLGTPSTGKYAGNKIPKEVLISAALDIPEENIDLSSGLPAATRAWASLSAVSEEKEAYLQMASGGNIKKINIDGSDELFVLNPNGTINPVDEKGTSGADVAELVGFAPIAVGGLTEVGLAFIPGAGPPVAFVAGPVVEGVLQESLNSLFRAKALNPALQEIQQDTINLADGSLKRGAITTAFGLGANGVGSFAGRVISKQVTGVVKPDKIAKETAKVISDLQKEAKILGIDLRLPDVPFGEMTMKIAQSEDAGRLYLEGAIKRLEDFKKNIFDPGYLLKNKGKFNEELDKLAKDQIQSYKYLKEEISAINVNAATTLGDALKRDLKEIQNLKASNGEYNFSQSDLSATVEPFNASLKKLRDGIVKISDDNYEAVRTSFKANPPKNPTKTQDFFKRMERKLSKDELNQLAELYAIEIKTTPTLKIKGDDAYKNLKSSRGFSSMNMNFDSLNKLYRLRSNIVFKEGKGIEQINFNKALKQERSKVLGTQGKKLLQDADDYYSNSVDPMREKIIGQTFKKFKGSDGLSGIKEHTDLTGVNNILGNKSGSAVENFDLAMKLFDEAKDPVAKQEYVKSLRAGYLLENGAFTGTPSGVITKPTVADKLLQERLFENQYDGMFKLLKEIKELGGSINPELGMRLLDSVSTLSKKESNGIYDQLKALSLNKIDKDRELGEILFKEAGQRTGIKNNGLLAEYIASTEISRESMETFLSGFDLDIKKDAFRALVMEELFANNQKSGYLFDGEKVIQILKNNEEKYTALFGKKKLSTMKKYADVVARIPKADAKLSKKATEVGNSKIAATMDGSKVRFYYRWLAGLKANPRKGSKILALHLQALGEGSDAQIRKAVLEMNPDYLVDEILVGKIMGQVLATDQGISLLFSQDDPMAISLLNDVGIYLNLMSSEQQAPEVKRRYPDIKK